MADTQRSIADITALLADNISGDISPQDLRDAFLTWRMGHGQLYVPAASAAAITISNTTNYFEATNPAWTLSASPHWFDESAGNGRLTYTGVSPVMVHVAATISFTCAQNNRKVHWRIGKSGTTDAASEVQRWVSTGADVGSTAMHLVTTLSNGEYLSLWARNATTADNVILQVANLQAVTMPM